MSTYTHDNHCDTDQPCAMCREPDAGLFMDDPLVGTLALRDESEDSFWERETAHTLAAVEEATCNDIDETIRLRAAAPAIIAPRLRRILFDVLDEGRRCSEHCNLHHEWQFATQLFPEDEQPSDEALQLRVKFIDLVIARLRDG